MRLHLLPLLTLAIAGPAVAFAQDAPHVLGTLTHEQLLASADSAWLLPGMAAYTPAPDAVSGLRQNLPNVDAVTVYYGSWCGDSRREVPRVLATLRAAGFAEANITAVGVSNEAALYKHSPDGAADGQSIYRVPTVVLSRGGQEIGRIIELPCTTVEDDLVAIASGADYTPNYRAFPFVDSLLAAGVVANANVTPYSLSKLIAPHLNGPAELTNVAMVLQVEDRPAEALQLLRANVDAHDGDAYAWRKLGEGYAATGDFEKAKRMIRTALRYAPGDDDLLDLFEAYVREETKRGGGS